MGPGPGILAYCILCWTYTLQLYYRQLTKFAKVMFLHVSVSHSVHRGVSASVHAGIPPQEETPRADTPRADTPQKQTPHLEQTPPRSRHPPGGQTPPWEQIPPQEQAPPPVQSMLGDTVNTRVVRILLECNLVWELKWDQELSKRITEPFCTLLGELMGELTVISMSGPGHV